MDKLVQLLNDFASIGLNQLGKAYLMNRKDEKYIVPLYRIINLLNTLNPEYQVLEIDKKRIFSYSSNYFDTPSLQLYQMHHAGKLNRYKIRFRNYLDSESTFFEIKKKDNHGRTLKSRMQSENKAFSYFSDLEKSYLENNTPLLISNLQYILNIYYNRITLIKHDKSERITIDLDLKYERNNIVKLFEGMAVVELKQEKTGNSPVKTFFKKEKIRKGGISKYCLGIILFFENIKYNRFLSKFNKIYKPYQTE